jgi:hypothetical protein
MGRPTIGLGSSQKLNPLQWGNAATQNVLVPAFQPITGLLINVVGGLGDLLGGLVDIDILKRLGNVLSPRR